MASGWTNEQVITWLKSLNPVFDKYEEKFKAEGVDGDMLMDIKDEDLEKQLGIPIKLHRNKILKCVAELKAKPADGAAAAPAAAAPVLAPPPAAAKEAKAVGGKRAAAAPADDEPAEKKRKTTAGPKGKAKASSKKKQKEEEEEEEEEEAEEKDEEDEAEEKGSSSSSSGGGPDGVYKLKAGGGEYHLISREGAEKETISECLERVGLPDIKGASYYMLGHKKESVSANKEIVVVPKSVIDAPKNGAEAVDGAEARKRIGLKGAGKINEDISGDYTVFVQSTSANRGLEPDAWLLSKVGGAATKGAAKGKAAKGKAPAKSKAKAKPKGKGKKKKDEEEDEEEEEEEEDD